MSRQLSRTTIATIGLSAALVLGAGTAAFAAGSSSSPSSPRGGDNPDRTAQRCARGATAIDKLDAAKSRLTERIQTLTEAKTAAEQAGHTARAARIAARIERLRAHLAKVDNGITRIQGWTTTHCPAPNATAPTTAN